MKILLINKFHFKKGGAETYYFTLAEALKRAGHDVIYFSMKHEKNIQCDESEYFVTNREYNDKTTVVKKIAAAQNLIYSKEAYNNLNKLIKNEKPDLAILSNIHRQLTTSVVDALYDNNIKIYWVVHDLITLCPNYTMLNSKGEICEECCNGKYFNCVKNKCIKNSYVKSYLGMKEAKYNKRKNIYSKVNLFITPSKFYREKLIEYGFDENKILWLRNPLPYNTKYEINTGYDEYILYFGRLSKEKGIKTLIDSVININYKLFIVGTGPLEFELKDYVIKNKIKNVEFKGFQAGEKLLDLIRHSRCVVLPSEWYENGPYSAMEAMALGKPLVVSNLGGLPELVENEANGYVFKNKVELREKVLKIISISDNEYSKMCSDALKKAKEMFNPEEYVERLI